MSVFLTYMETINTFIVKKLRPTGVLAYKMDEFIKESFVEIGGQATRSAPLGWSGVVRQYIEDWTGTDNCY